MGSVLRSDALGGRTILVTGGGSGLGLSMASRFVELGGSVFLVGRSPDRLEAAAARIGVEDRVGWASADVRDPAAIGQAVAAAADRFGGIDAVVNNAAGNFLAATEDLSANAFNAVVQTVLYGTFHVTQAAGRLMIGAGGGSILNVVAAYAWTGSAFVVPSACAKAGVLAMTRSLAVEWAAYGIRCNAIAPGPFPTEGAWSRLLPTEEHQAASLARVPAGRFGDHGELAELAAFMLSDGSPYQTGDCVTIDGGRWLTAGGEFNALASQPRDRLKAQLEAMKPPKRGA